MKKHMKNIFKFIISILICQLAGVAGSFFTTPSIKTWYVFLVKPSFNPPNFIFAPVWTALFLLMGVSLYLVWKKNWHIEIKPAEVEQKTWNPISKKLFTGSWREENAVLIFSVQLVLNVLWSVIFFGFKSPGLAFFEILMLWFAILYTIVNFYRISKVAGLLLLPYILWVSFAAVLNYSVWQLNLPQSDNAVVKVAFDPENATYTVEGGAVATAWGESSLGDLNADKIDDAALIVTSEPGGSGTFYYITAALQNEQSGSAIGTNAILLGDRIAPQNFSIDNGKIMVNYADRKQSEPFTTRPSVGITRYFEVQGSVLTEVTEDSAKKEQACLLSVGTIGTSLCCQSSGDFPNTNLIGACGCSPQNSHEVKVCDCGPDRVFDGTGCVDQSTFCQPQQRQGDVCFQLYDPVCAKVNIQCVTTPCDPINQTFSNSCEACRNSLVESYTRGECVNQ